MPEAPYFEPPLTTVIQEFKVIGEAAMSLLISRISGVKGPKTIPTMPHLVVRESTRRI
jgi:DNA-binding LacI/PurR family transcriptional regulator